MRKESAAQPGGAVVKTVALSEIVPDDHNFNRGTIRGQQMLADSLRAHKAARSILLDKNNRVIAGNKTFAAAQAQGDLEIVVVESHGERLIAHKRTDLDLDDPETRALALADNRIQEVDLEWDLEQLSAMQEKGLDLTTLFNENELALLLHTVSIPDDPKEIGKGLDLPDMGDQANRHRQIFVNFKTPQDVIAFAALLECNITEKTKDLWFPKQQQTPSE